MAVHKKDRIRTKRRIQRVKSRIKSNLDLPRVSVFRSLNNIYAQIIDDNTGNTLISCSSQELKDVKGDKKTVAHAVGLELAKRAKEKGVAKVVFDRGRYLYHGRVQALADGLREGKIQI